MMRFVGVDIQKGVTYRHYEDIEKKMKMDRESIIKKDPVIFRTQFLGEPWKSEKEDDTK